VLVEAPHCLALQSYLILHSSQSNLILSMCKMLALPWHSSMWPGYEAKTLGSDNVHRSGPNVNVSCSLTLQTWQPIETENPLTDMTKFIFILILWLLNMNYTQVWIWLFCKHQWINLDMKPDYGTAKQAWIRAFLNINWGVSLVAEARDYIRRCSQSKSNIVDPPSPNVKIVMSYLLKSTF